MGLLGIIGFFLLLLLLKVPIGYSLAIPAFVYLWVSGIPMTNFIIRMTNAVDSFTMLAIPLFVFAGLIMNQGGVTNRLFAFASSLVGHFRAGLAHVNIVASIIFAGMSGSALADAAGLGAVEIEAMEDAGYPSDLAAAVTAASSVIGPIIPPSITMVVYAVAAEESIGRLFLGGFVPGLLLGLCMMLLVRFLYARLDLPVAPRATLKEIGSKANAGVLALVMPLIIVGGIIFGVFTPTEAAAAATIYAILVSVFFFQALDIRSFGNTIVEGMKISGNMLFVIAAAGMFNWILAREGAASMLVEWFSQFDFTALQFLLFLNLVFLFLGMFLEPLSLIIIAVPILQPLLVVLGIDMVHFGIMISLNLMIGMITPPFGLSLFVMTQVSKAKYGDVVRACVPFYIPLLIVLLIITVFPRVVLWLPSLLM